MKENKTVVTFVRERIREEYADYILNFMKTDDHAYYSIENFRESLRCEICTLVLKDSFGEVEKLSKIFKRLFHPLDKLLEELRGLFTEKEFKRFTEFMSIFTEDNEVELEDSFSDSDYLDPELLSDQFTAMFLDQLANFEDKDFDNKDWVDWIKTMSCIQSKLKIRKEKYLAGRGE